MQGRGKGWLVRDRVLGRRFVGKTPLQKALGTVVLRTIFILLGLRGSHSTTVGNSLEQKIGSEAAAYVVS